MAEELGITTTTLYDYVNGDGSPKKVAQEVLSSSTEDAFSATFRSIGLQTSLIAREYNGGRKRAGDGTIRNSP
ncbi:MAG: hypothetical protein ABFS45_07415 [Pseudomonadota bacterium]